MLGRILFLLTVGAIASPAADEWDNLKQVTHRRSYGFALRDGTCVTGRIVAVTADSVKIKQPNPATLKRPDVVRVSDGTHVYDVVYSGRSSWSDVLRGLPSTREYLRVVTKDGTRYEGDPAQFSESGLTLSKKGRSEKIQKTDVARVYYVRLKPLSDSAQYSAQEHFILDAQLWPYYWNIGVHMPVLIYDSPAPEDNSKIVCSGR